MLIDPWTPRVNQTLLAALPPEEPNESADLAEERQFVTDFPRDPTQNSEHLLVAASDEEVIALLDKPGKLFGDRRVIVLQAPFPERPAGLPRDYDAVARAAWHGRQRGAGRRIDPRQGDQGRGHRPQHPRGLNPASSWMRSAT